MNIPRVCNYTIDIMLTQMYLCYVRSLVDLDESTAPCTAVLRVALDPRLLLCSCAAKVNHTFAYLEGLYAIINEKQVTSFTAVFNVPISLCFAS